MKLICYGSSSRGNGYILQGRTQTLLIEAGLPVCNVRHFVKDFGKIQGCIISHRHGDHAKYMGDFMKAGITCYANEDVWEGYGGEIYKRGHINPPYDTTEIGEFRVVPMYANHDVPCWGYLIHHEEMGTLLFVTDSADFGYTFESIDHVMIECNWSEECLSRAIEDNRTNRFVARRTRMTHMGLEVLIDYLQYEKCFTASKEIILLHLSSENADAQQFVHTVSERLKKDTYVAEYGFQIDLK